MAWKMGKNLGGRPPKSRPVTTPEMARQAAQNLVNGMKPGQALKAAGFPEGTYRNGKNGINRAIRDELMKSGRKFIKMGKDLTPEDQASLVKGRLAENVIVGSDAGAMSAKVLGSDKRVSMWTPESQTGVIILHPPPVPVIKHRVEILPPIDDNKPISK